MSKFKPLYRNSFEEAMRLDEHEKWRESLVENLRCRDFIDSLIRENYDGFHLNSGIAEKTIEEFGHDRTRWVMANTIQHFDYDGRISPQNKAWAADIYIPRPESSKANDPTRHYNLDSHLGLVDMVARHVQKQYNDLNLYDHRHRVEGNIHDQDFTNRVLILRDDVLNEASRTPENQLFFANVGGFGCQPHASGRAVIGEFLIDGEKTRFNREDFVGIVDERFLPDWAKEKLQEQTASDEQEQAEAPEIKMKGL